MIYPRVTEVLAAYGNYDKIPSSILVPKANIGNTVHALCAGISKGAWIPEGMIAEECLGYVQSFKLWHDDFVHETEIIEQRYNDETEGYTGQIDQVITAKDTYRYLVDLKTTARQMKTHPVQVAAYERLLKCNGITVHGAILLYLQKDGSMPKFLQLNNLEQERHVFSAALICWRYFNARKLCTK